MEAEPVGSDSRAGVARTGRRTVCLWLAGFVVVTAVGFWIATRLDAPVHAYLLKQRSTLRQWWSTDCHRMFRVTGYIPTWLLLALAVALIDAPGGVRSLWSGAKRRGLWVALAPVSCALASETLKLLIRRQRPPYFLPWEGHYVWRAWSDRPLSTSQLGLPSGHAAVAFAGALLLCRMYPRAAPVWLTLALGCATSRVIFHAHFVSDVWASAALAFIVVRCIWALRRRCCLREPSP